MICPFQWREPVRPGRSCVDASRATPKSLVRSGVTATRITSLMGLKNWTEEDNQKLAIFLTFWGSVLPWGWILMTKTIMLGPVFIAQLAMVLAGPVASFRFICFRTRKLLLAAFVALIVYFAVCFLTNLAIFATWH